MTITTKFQPGDTCFLMHNNRVRECRIDTASIEVACKVGESITTTNIVYVGRLWFTRHGLNWSGTLPEVKDLEEAVISSREDELFLTKDELLKSL